MNFKSRKSLLFTLLTFGVLALVFWILYADYAKNDIALGNIWPHILGVSCVGLLLWTYVSTNYSLSKEWLTYQSGPFKGKISIKKITAVEVNKTLWVGLKPATATNGLIIKYNTYDKLYISPITNNSFCDALIKMNASIKITPH